MGGERHTIIKGPPSSSRQTGETPLMMAATIGNLEVVKELLSAGADVLRQNVHGVRR